MAIGDTVQAGLMRVDSSPILLAGQAQAKANQAFGNALGQAAEGYFIGKEKKERAKEIEEELIRQGASPESAKAISKNPFLQKEHARKQEADQRMAIEKMRVSAQQAISGAARTQRAALEETRIKERNEAKAELEENQQKQIGLSNFLMSGTEMDPEVLEDFNQAQPGLFALGGDQGARNRFLEYRRDTAPKVGKLGGELESSEFASKAMEAGVDPVLAGNYFMKLQAREDESLQNAPSISRVGNELNPETGEYEQIARDKFGNPIANYGPPKPSGMYRTPEEARKEVILVGRTKDAMESVKSYVEGSNLAIKQAEQANLALRNLPDTTGGITSFVNDMKVLAESVGIDLPEEYTKDMKDIGVFRQLTGQFLFNAMSNTKGSITENEMRLFRKISPDIDNSKAANEAMLELYVKSGERAKGRRKLVRELQEKDVDPREIERAIEKFDEENSLIDDIQALAPQSTQQPFRSPQGDVNGKVVGTKPNGDKLIDVNGQIFVQPAQ